ncbi:hypothetical protein [Aeoliella sp.]|uniref:hypothetical protein n=1 Tax=Aeoliella sp. TaxID=2795800 RepID=UPI003CCC26AC
MIRSLRLYPRTWLIAWICHVFWALAGSAAWGANFQDIYRWSSTSADGAMLSQGDATTLRWSIVDDGQDVEGGSSDLVAYLDGIYGTTPGDDLSQRPWFATLQAQFDNIAAKTGLTFEYVEDASGDWNEEPAAAGEADIRVAGVAFPQPGQLGEAERPSNGGDIRLDTDNTTFHNPALLGGVFQHELGHSLGLLHVTVPGSTPLLGTSSFPLQGPQFDDLYALTRLYGDKFEAGGGNDQSTGATLLGTLATGIATTVGSDADDLHIDFEQTDFVTIDGTSDVDYYRIEVPFASEATITLTPRGPTYTFFPENLPQQSLAAGSLSNLRFRLLSGDGQTPLVTHDLADIGEEEQLASFDLPSAGTYYVEVSGAENLNQFYELSVQPDVASFAQTPWVFRDAFNAAGDLNDAVDAAPRQAAGQVDSPYEFQQGTTPSGDPAVEITDGKLFLRGVQGATGADSPSVSAVRNFAPQLSGEKWLLSLEVHLEASASSEDAAFALTLADSWPIGEPLSDDADLTVKLSKNNRYRIVEAGGNANGEVTRQGLAFGPDYLLQVLVDDTQALPKVTVAIDGVTLLTGEELAVSQLERYFALHVLTGSSLASMESVSAEIDNLSIAIVTDTLPGDYNLDGVVNLADYTTWRNLFGRRVLAGTQADGNANGRIDAADYDFWKSSFAAAANAGAYSHAVPEPTSCLLGLLAGSSLLASVRRIA